NSAGTRVAQSVSSGSGRFQVQAPSAGSYSLRVLRIGYQPYEVTRRFDGTAPSEETIRLSGLPVALPEIAVAGSSKCGERALGDTLSSAIWTQAGTALAITAQTVRSRSYRFQTALEQRQVDLVGTTSTPAVTNELGISAWPVRSPPPDTLLASGFVENLEDLQVGPTWYGPDPEFLLSDPFFAGHCFRAVPADSSSEAGWVGLAFEPAARDMRADIRGTLWLDRATAELRRLEFEYTRLPRWARGSEAGGTLAFAPLPEGGWIVQKWMIRVPVPEVEVATGRAKVLGYRESGGHVVAVLDASGVVLQRYPQ
ncbi:MAG TPA: carboxypeptidase-like regulatory domain-containing protein, partial [Gemmatimonadales bacterium]|nr:carboxypeptidase-like regulatory domain-containing protein [Gemmatimonadales bacterium]